VYDGVDYRQSGAVYEFVPCRFVLFGNTTFENMNFNALGTNLLVVAQHHKVTVGEGVTITGDRAKLTGDTVARSFCILGGYQSGQSEPPVHDDRDTDITVLSGSKIYILPSRGSLKGPYTGTAHIKIGGTADVSTLHLTAAYPDGAKLAFCFALSVASSTVSPVTVRILPGVAALTGSYLPMVPERQVILKAQRHLRHRCRAV